MGSFIWCLQCSSSIKGLVRQIHPLQKSQLHSSHLHFEQHLLHHHYHLQEQQQQQKPKKLSSSFEGKWFHLLKSCHTKNHLLQLHAHLIRTSLIQDIDVSVALLSHNALYTSMDTDYPCLVFNQVQTPTTTHYNAMIRGYSKRNLPRKVFCLYNNMRRDGFHVDTISASFVLKSCNHVYCLIGGKQLHGRILQDGQQYDSLLLTSLMCLYASCGSGIDAQMIFDEMPAQDTVAWNVLISCYIRNKRTRDALGLFDLMQLPPYYLKPDDVTCLLMLQACSKLNAVDFGQRIHKYIEEHGYNHALNLRNSLIVMYSKCGLVDKAFHVFRDTPMRNVSSWSAMISALAMNGYGRDALEAFKEMQKQGIMPDEHTFTGVLSACSHSGMIDDGFQVFYLMSSEYGISPNNYHYGCMVDLMGRAGMLDEAYGFIVNSMNVKPDPTVWRTLLAACKKHGRYTLGERVIGHLIELNAQEAGDFVLLLNMYASAGNWEKVVELRKLMKEKNIQTSPGCSTMELHGVVHEFIADDTAHPRKIEIYKMLDEIVKQLKLGGYVANMESELHNLDSEMKETTLSYHSEKLAIAFGVLATTPGTTIRIAKNLRICVDCHNFSKVLSSVYNRVIIIRDRSCFHHFREGRCSCHDYW